MDRTRLVRGLRAGAAALALLWLGAAPVVGQQTTGRIQGRVVEAETGRPLQGARISLEGSNRVVVTNADGQYVLAGVPVGTATIRVRLIGYGGMGQTLSVSPGAPVTADFQMTRSAISLDDIVVTGTGREVEQRRLTAPVNVISAQEIESTPVTDVAQLLQGKVAGGTVNATSAQPDTSALFPTDAKWWIPIPYSAA